MRTKKPPKNETLLEQRCREFGIRPPETHPLSTDIIVWRLPPVTGHRVQGTNIVLSVPEEAESPNIRGLLLAAGYKALDDLEKEGIRVGHIVVFKRFAGWEHEENLKPGERTPEYKRAGQIIHIHMGDILTSDDLYHDVKEGRTKFVKDTKTGTRYVEQKPTQLELKEFKEANRRKKIAALAASTHSPHEAATANRLLGK